MWKEDAVKHNEKVDRYSNIVIVKGNTMQEVIDKLEFQTELQNENSYGYGSVRKIVQVIKLTNKIGIALFSGWKSDNGFSKWD